MSLLTFAQYCHCTVLCSPCLAFFVNWYIFVFNSRVKALVPLISSVYIMTSYIFSGRKSQRWCHHRLCVCLHMAKTLMWYTNARVNMARLCIIKYHTVPGFDENWQPGPPYIPNLLYEKCCTKIFTENSFYARPLYTTYYLYNLNRKETVVGKGKSVLLGIYVIKRD